MRGSAKKPPKGIREKQERASHTTGHPLPLCSQLCSPSSVSFQLQLISSLASCPADVPLPKTPFLPPHPSGQHILLSPFLQLILSALLQLCPNPGFRGLLLCFPAPLPGPSSSCSSGEQLGGLRWALTAVSQVVGSGSCKESRASCQGGPGTPGHAQLPIPSPPDPPGAPSEPPNSSERADVP